VATVSTRGLKRLSTLRTYIRSGPRFRALLTDEKGEARFDV
jgi:hypothetical protein